jgi:hypothetical protein
MTGFSLVNKNLLYCYLVSALVVTSAGENAAGKTADTKHKTKIVPSPCVRVGVYPDVVGEKTNNESNWSYKTVPEPNPESWSFAKMGNNLRLCCHAGQKNRRYDGNCPNLQN